MNCTAEAAITSSSCKRTNFIVNTAFDSICQQQLSLKIPKFLFRKYTMRVSKRRIAFNFSLLSPPQLNSPPNSFVSICQRSLSVKLHKCVFKKCTTRVAKRPIVFCFSLNSPLFCSSVLYRLQAFTQFPSRRKEICAEGLFLFHEFSLN